MNRGRDVAWLVGALVLCGVGGLMLHQARPSPPVASSPSPVATFAFASSAARTDGLQIVDRATGRGRAAKAGDRLRVHWELTLTNGTQVDTRDSQQPFELTLGQHQVIDGWEKGLPGMRVGGKRHLVIPAAMGYGDRAAGQIPANSTLIFDVHLLAINPPAAAASGQPCEP